MAEACDYPIRTVVRNGVVRFEYKPSDSDFVQRKFTIRPTTFWQRLVSKNAQMSGIPPPSADWYGKQVNAGSGDSAGSGSGGGGPGGWRRRPGGGGVINNNAGGPADFDLPSKPGINAAQVFFNPSNGQLLVRAPLADLDLIEQAIEILNTWPSSSTLRPSLLRSSSMTANLSGLIGTLVNPHCWVIRSSAVLVRILPYW